MSADPRAIAVEVVTRVGGTGDVGLLDQWVHPDVVDHQPGMQGGGLAEMKAAVVALHENVDVESCTAEDTVAEGDKVMVRWVLRGRARESHPQLPPGTPIRVAAMTVFRFVDGRVAERWVNRDETSAILPRKMTRVFDAHNDLLMELAYRREEARPFEGHWLGPLQTGEVKVQVCPVFTAFLPEGERLRGALFQLGAFHRAVADHPREVRWIRTREDLDELIDGDPRIGLIPALEGLDPVEEDLEMVDAFWDLGVRMAGLTWNRSNRFATGGGEADDAGLTAAGRELVKRMQERGYVVDLTHSSEQTFFDAVGISAGPPPVITHTGCRAVYDTPRNVSDEQQLRALADAGGVAGIIVHPLAVDLDRPTADRVVDHAEHAAAVMGDDHVGIGSDVFAQVVRSGAAGEDPAANLPKGQRAGAMAADASIEGIEGPQGFGRLVQALEARGWSGPRLEGILFDNFYRTFREALPSRSEH